MAIVKVLPEVNLAVSSANAVAAKYTMFWFSGFTPCIAADLAIGTVKVANCQGSVELTPMVQFAEVRPDKPRAPAVVAGFTPITADNEYFVTFSMASAPGNTYVRFGLGVRVTAAGTGTADVGMQVSLQQLGMLLSPWVGHLVATSTTTLYIPIGPWMPALGITAFEATTVVSDITGNAAADLVYRTAEKSIESPDAWSAGILSAALTANGEANSGERTVSLTGKMWVQPGLLYKLTSGSTAGQMDISVLLGVRQAT